jgi:hypothetical protein
MRTLATSDTRADEDLVFAVPKTQPDCVKTRRSFEMQPMITSFA